MKKLLLCFYLTSCFYVSAQTTIFEEKDNKQYLYYKSTLLPNSNYVLIWKDLYDVNGNKKPISSGDFKRDFFVTANSENSFFNIDQSNGQFNPRYEFIVNGNVIVINKPEINDYNISIFDKKQNFTSKYVYNLVDI
jgi:hypothetical protein